MTKSLSENTKAILLLTAPLMLNRGGQAPKDLLKLGEYNRLVRLLREASLQPSDLLNPEAPELLSGWRSHFDPARLTSLLGRGFQLSQAVNAWATRAIWIVSRADPEYPRRLKVRMREMAPPVLFGCGDASLADAGGLAVVGSRKVDDSLLEGTRKVARAVAATGAAIVSGGAKGVDRAAMEGALEAGGQVVGILADSLARLAVASDSREFIRDGRLLLLSAFDPGAGFNVGNAMQRNKYIYGLADAGLVMNADYQKGGTWAGAEEQLKRWHFCPIYVRSAKDMPKGNRMLLEAGAHEWPAKLSSESLGKLLDSQKGPRPGSTPAGVYQGSLFPEGFVSETVSDREGDAEKSRPIEQSQNVEKGESLPVEGNLAEAIYVAIKPVLMKALSKPRSGKDMAEIAELSVPIVKKWLERLCEEGLVEKTKRPQRYVVKK